ncbi:MAG: hypothetical protein IPG64_10990 [Haliea sp.]|nr:hypothetical protein [Haliea sp.]
MKSLIPKDLTAPDPNGADLSFTRILTLLVWNGRYRKIEPGVAGEVDVGGVANPWLTGRAWVLSRVCSKVHS